MRYLFALLLFGSVSVSAVAEAHTIAAGPMVGATTATSANIWVQTSQPTSVQVKYNPEGHTQIAASAVVTSTPASFLTAQVTLANLKPQTRYHYQIWLNGQPQERDYPTSFQTPPLPGQPRDFSVAIGSCLFVQGALMNTLGIRYGDGHDILKTIDGMKPDLMLWLGDNVYMNPIESASENGVNQAYAYTRSLPILQPLLAGRPNYAIWDDHDYGPNNGDSRSPMKQTVLKVFRHYWANPAYGTPQAPGVYHSFQWADTDFFMLDDRYYRGPNTVDDPSRPFLGEAQLHWLKQRLLQSKATFKFIAIGNQVLNYHTRAESYHHYRQEHEHLLNWLKTQRITGVVFLSGDRHHTELIVVTDKTPYPLLDFTSSPLTSRPLGIGREADNPWRVKGTLVADQRTYGILRIKGQGDQRELIMECYDRTGKKRWYYSVFASELR